MFHSRQHLIQWLQDNLTDRLLQNILQRGQLELLGAFNPLPGSSIPGWIVVLTSYITGQGHFICIGVDEKNGSVRWWRTKEVNWQNWDGDKSSNSLYYGDNPEAYREWKNAKST